MIDRHDLAILRTVVYASLFDYPLTLDELHESLISAALTRDQILTAYEGSALLRSEIEYRGGYFYPRGRADLIAERHRREARARALLDRHQRLLRWLCALPFTRLVALSGSIAHLNLEERGDLDLFIITRGRRVWLVTVAMLILTRLLGVRRLVCANLVMADTHLTVEPQDLFTANQILALKPLIGEQVLEGFVAANPFVRRFYPNRRSTPCADFLVPVGGGFNAVKSAVETVLSPFAGLLDSACRRAYAWHLNRKSRTWRSPDQVQLQADYLKLHTKSHRQWVLARFDERVEERLSEAERAAIA